ncbi:FHIPEP family type III secretion protein [Streptomyces sp. NPDC059063]|uniref:FHIPEP family type III secretion protein n=1 Tax=unclassified Streptomyces TaxID=2593676 RepID=UPI0036C8904D
MTAAAGTPPVPVLVHVRPPLSALLGHEASREAVRRRVGAGIDDVLTALGVPGHAEVDVAVVTEQGPRGRHDFWADVHLHGVLCRYPAHLLTRVAARLAGEHCRGWSAPPTIPRDGDSASWTVELLGLLCAEAVKRAPQLLFGPAQAAAFADELRAYSEGVPKPLLAPETLRPTFRHVLAQGIGIGDAGAVVKVLRCSVETVPELLAEQLAASLAPDHIELLAPNELHDRLTGGAPEAEGLLAFLARGLFDETGLVFPPVALRPSDGLPPGSFSMRFNHVQVLPVQTLSEQECMVNESVEQLRARGIAAEPMANPASFAPAARVPSESEDALTDAGLTTWNRANHVILCLAQEMRERAGALVRSDRLQAQLDTVAESFPDVVAEVRARHTPMVLSALRRRLARDAVPVTDLPTLLDRLIDVDFAAAPDDWQAVFGACPPTARLAPATPPDTPTGLDALEDLARSGLRRTSAVALSRHTSDTVAAYLLDPEVERVLTARAPSARSREWEDALLEAFMRELADLPPTASWPVVLVQDRTRRPLKQLLRTVLPRLPVAGYAELPATVDVAPVARISLDVGRDNGTLRGSRVSKAATLLMVEAGMAEESVTTGAEESLTPGSEDRPSG